MPVTLTTADRFARIAAHAMETGAVLLSFDVQFGDVDGLAWTALSSA